MGSFKEGVRTKKVAAPTDRKFSLEKWDSHWAKTEPHEKEDHDLYLGGEIFHSLFDEIRSKIAELYQRTPDISANEFLRGLIAISNRNRALIVNLDIESIEGKDIRALSSENNIFGNDITLQELGDGAVDGIAIAIRSHLSKNKLGEKTDNSIDPMGFILDEAALSQLYGIYESYWLALLWGEYELNCLDEEEKVYEVRQQDTPWEKAFEITQGRRIKLLEEDLILFIDERYHFLVGEMCYIKIHGSGKSKKIISARLKNSGSDIKAIYLSTLLSIENAKSYFPELFFTKRNENMGFCIKDVYSVLVQLKLLSMQMADRFPKESSAYNIKKLNEYSPKFKRLEVAHAISKSIDEPVKKIESIIEFLTFKIDKNIDLWCHPVIDLKNGEITLLSSALEGGVLDRITEHWLVTSKFDLQIKGNVYEKLVTEMVKVAIEENELFKNYNSPISVEIKINNCREEIDFLMRLGNIVIVGECKSVVVTDSSISHHRTKEILQHASEQAKRKSIFARENIDKVFEKCKWKFEKEIEYKFIPLVIISNKINSGFKFNDVFVSDEILLERYFSNNEMPLLSSVQCDKIAWFELYKTEKEAIENFPIYLENPPQLSRSVSDLEYKSMKIPILNQSSFKIMYTRLALTPIDPYKLIQENKFSFPIKKSDNFEEKIFAADFFA